MQVGIAIDDDYMIEFGESIDLGLKSGDFSDHCSSLVKHKSSPVHHSPEYVLTCLKKKTDTIWWLCLNCHRIGLWENLQESPIFDGKNHGFL